MSALARRAGSARWKLVTPPGTADNGGLVLAGAAAIMLSGNHGRAIPGPGAALAAGRLVAQDLVDGRDDYPG